MNSNLFMGHVEHERFHPTAHQLNYRLYVYALDLAELDLLDRRLPLFGYNRSRPVALHDSDYLAEQPGTIRRKLMDTLAPHIPTDRVSQVFMATKNSTSSNSVMRIDLKKPRDAITPPETFHVLPIYWNVGEILEFSLLRDTLRKPHVAKGHAVDTSLQAWRQCPGGRLRWVSQAAAARPMRKRRRTGAIALDGW